MDKAKCQWKKEQNRLFDWAVKSSIFISDTMGRIPVFSFTTKKIIITQRTTMPNVLSKSIVSLKTKEPLYRTPASWRRLWVNCWHRFWFLLTRFKYIFQLNRQCRTSARRGTADNRRSVAWIRMCTAASLSVARNAAL